MLGLGYDSALVADFRVIRRTSLLRLQGVRHLSWRGTVRHLRWRKAIRHLSWQQTILHLSWRGTVRHLRWRKAIRYLSRRGGSY